MTRRDGFTLIEILIALVILAIVILGMASMTGKFARVVADGDRAAVATQLAEDRTQLVQTDPDYGGLDSTYATTETNLTGFPGYSRITAILRVDTGGIVYKRITVTVISPANIDTVRRTVVVGEP